MVLHELCTPRRMFIGRSRVELIRILYAIRRRRMGGLTMPTSESRFRYECHGEIKNNKGILVQTSLFDL